MKFITYFFLVLIFAKAHAVELMLVDIPLPKEPYYYIDTNFHLDVKAQKVHVDVDLVKYRESPIYSVPLWSRHEVEVTGLNFNKAELTLSIEDRVVNCGRFEGVILLDQQDWNLTGECSFVERRTLDDRGERVQIYLISR